MSKILDNLTPQQIQVLVDNVERVINLSNPDRGSKLEQALDILDWCIINATEMDSDKKPPEKIKVVVAMTSDACQMYVKHAPPWIEVSIVDERPKEV